MLANDLGHYLVVSTSSYGNVRIQSWPWGFPARHGRTQNWMVFVRENPIWWFSHPSEKYEFVNWDEDSNPINMGKFKNWQPNHQPAI